MTFLWMLFTTTLGAIIGGMFYASPWIGAGLGFLIGLILSVMAKGATGSSGDFWSDAFDFDGGFDGGSGGGGFDGGSGD